MSKKTTFGAESRSYLARRPTWRFGRIRMDPPFGWGDISREEVESVVSHLSALEKMTWNDILVTARKQNHFCDVSKLSKPARALINADWQNAEQLLALRLTNLKRVWGFLEQGILYIMWWDPNHEVYPSTFKDRYS
ncbi:MAG: hypothetical protein JO036_00535 [Candidatus Eremiobacteraeota bacterium]|nr:hypothetical protein [Candidatus Eremiobacteraeota bacterium]